MVRWFTLLIVVLSLAAGVLAGTPLHEPNDGMMKCCKRAKSKERSPIAEGSRLCCAINCSTSAPASSAASFNSAPSNITITKSIADQIAELFAKQKAAPAAVVPYTREVLSRSFRPKFIQHSSFLI